MLRCGALTAVSDESQDLETGSEEKESAKNTAGLEKAGGRVEHLHHKHKLR